MSIGSFFGHVWRGIKNVGKGIYHYGRGVLGNLKGDSVGNPDSPDKWERLAYAGANTANVLKGYVPAALQAVYGDDMQGLARESALAIAHSGVLE